MSGPLVSAVFESALPAWLKPYAAACASFACDNGTRVFPTVATIAQMVGRCERSTHYALAELRRCGVLTVEVTAGRYRATRYVLQAAALPRATDPKQLALFPQATAAQIRRSSAPRTEFSTDIHRFPQPWVQSTAAMGAMGCTRSVSDPSRTSTHQKTARAIKTEGTCPRRANAKAS